MTGKLLFSLLIAFVVGGVCGIGLMAVLNIHRSERYE